MKLGRKWKVGCVMSLVQTRQTNGRALVTFFPKRNRAKNYFDCDAIKNEVDDCLSSTTDRIYGNELMLLQILRVAIFER